MMHFSPNFREASRHRMSLYVTSVCNLTCPECIMQHIMKHNFKYQMSLPEIKKLIWYSEDAGYAFDFVLTGGEPLLWRNMEPCLKRLRRSPITKSITMFTNSMMHHRLNDEIVSCLDSIRISQYDGNEKHMDYMLESYPEKVKVVNRTEFWKNPLVPLENTSPVECLNPERLFYDGQVYACPHALSIDKVAKSGIRLGVPLGRNFLQSMGEIKRSQAKDICSMCVSNMKVRQQVVKIHNET